MDKAQREEGEAISGDEDLKTQDESREGSYSGQDINEKSSDKRSRQKKKHKRKNRFVLEISNHVSNLLYDEQIQCKGNS